MVSAREFNKGLLENTFSIQIKKPFKGDKYIKNILYITKRYGSTL